MKSAFQNGSQKGKKYSKGHAQKYYFFYTYLLVLLCLGGCVGLKYSLSGRTFLHGHKSVAHELSMTRKLPHALFTLILGFVFSGNAHAATYYVAANGSDSNNGTSQSSPWAHAPGMSAATGLAASTRINAGDSIIFRGGDTWHFNSTAPSISTWKWTANGSSGSNIYIGVDQTWYTGSSWTRPVLTGDNPANTSFVGSCAHDLSNTAPISIDGTYWQFDNFEITGICWSSTGNNGNGFFTANAGPGQFSNIYCHGWTATSGSSDNFPCFTAFFSGSTDITVGPGVVVDGSDSPHFTAGSSSCQSIRGDACASGQAMNGSRFANVYQSVFRYVSNILVTSDCKTIHDNLFEYLYETYSGASGVQHPNVMNCLGGTANTDLYFYNNTIRNTFVHEDVYLALRTNAYVFNNVFFNNMSCPSGCSPAGFMYVNNAGGANSTVSFYFYNNTVDSSSLVDFAPSNAPLLPFSGNGIFQNNHFIGISSLGGAYTNSGAASLKVSDNGNEVYQTVSAANGQGYTASNNYAPTGSGGATVGTGANLSGNCSVFSSDNDFCMGTSGSVLEANGSGGQLANFPAINMTSRPASSAWDAGAYMYGSSTSKLNPPTNLSATVQ